MKKRITKILTMGVLIVMSISLFAGCGTGTICHVRFEVIGGGGGLMAKRIGVETDMPTDWSLSSPTMLKGGKDTVFQVEFTAIPNDGYRVKEWTCTSIDPLRFFDDYNAEYWITVERVVVKDNKSNTFVLDTTEYNFLENAFFITVEFEPIN